MAELGWNGEKCCDRDRIKGSGTLQTEMAPQGPGAGFLEAGVWERVLRAAAFSICEHFQPLLPVHIGPGLCYKVLASLLVSLSQHDCKPTVLAFWR